MRALVQRVSEASVSVEGKKVAQIGLGFLVYLGVGRTDTAADAEFLARKIGSLRIFSDSEDRMNLSLKQVSGELLIVSQFTLYAETRKGNRPSYSDAARPEEARVLYEHFIQSCRAAGHTVQCGIFQAHMEVRSVNNGPVTLLCLSESDLRPN